jgi:hypothetical protein
MTSTRLKVTYNGSDESLADTDFNTLDATGTEAYFSAMIQNSKGDTVAGMPKDEYIKLTQQIVALEREAEMDRDGETEGDEES